MAKIKIWSNGGYKQGVELDGEDISSAVKATTFTMGAGEPADVQLDLAVFELEVNADDAKVYITNEARDLLIRAGWRAPKDEQL